MFSFKDRPSNLKGFACLSGGQNATQLNFLEHNLIELIGIDQVTLTMLIIITQMTW